jgi:hypothetical protein
MFNCLVGPLNQVYLVIVVVALVLVGMRRDVYGRFLAAQVLAVIVIGGLAGLLVYLLKGKATTEPLTLNGSGA